jgi:ADP-heptose:LPS heptosyltransferase
VVLFPGASVPERRWGTEKFIELGRRLINDGHFIIICGGDADKKAAQTIASSLGERVLNLTGCLSLTQTTAILSEAGLLVTSDSGLMHLAYAVGTPTISLFGAGIEEKWAPRGAKHHVLNKRLPCSPCTRFGYTPPCPYDVECLKRVTVEEVCAAVHKILPADIMKTPGH